MRHLIPIALLTVACSSETPKGWPPCANPVFDAQGHRGARAQRPENTLPAMEYALQKGVRTLELDLSVTQDDVLVLSHDPHLLPERCLTPDGKPADNVPIRSLTVQQLQQYDCGTLKNARFPAQQPVPKTPPPTLASVLELAERMGGGNTRYNIETKIDPEWDPSLTPTPEKFAELVDKALREANVVERSVVQSFDPRTLVALKKMGSKLRTSLLVGGDRWAVIYEKLLGDPVARAAEIGAAVLSPEWHLASASLVNAAHAKGIAVIPWTINEEQVMLDVIANGVDGIISDDVDLLMRVVKERVPKGQGVCF
ncbi:MAG: glycerophosphodiester phosphodiesterase family protein [Myxococcota bacterium]